MSVDAQKTLNQDSISFLKDKVYPASQQSLGIGFYDAIVTRCVDKSRPGWVKVSIHGVTDELGVSDQPWAEPAPAPQLQVPSPGTSVKVTFRDGDVHFPVWHSAGAQANGNFLPIHESTKDYPNNHILYNSPDGTIVKNNLKTGDFEINHSSGTRITIAKDGTMEITGEGINPLIKKFQVVTGAAICPYLSTINKAPTPHPLGKQPLLSIDDIQNIT
jgi:hypothetical protein